MADGKLPLSPASPGGQIEDVEQLNVVPPVPPPPPVGQIALVRQRIQIVGRLYSQISAVLDSDPAANAFGLVVRGVDAAKETTLLTSNVLLTAIRDRLPALLVGGRLDTNIGSWLGSTAPTVGQKIMAASVPVTLASDQSPLPVAVSAGTDRTATGTILTNETVEINTQASGACGVQLSGVWTGTIVFEATVDGAIWNPVLAVNSVTSAEVTFTTVNGNWVIACAGFQKVRMRGNLVTSGAATGFLDASTCPQVVTIGGPIPAGSATIGGVEVRDGVDQLDINASGQAAIQDPPNLDVALSTRASEATVASILANQTNGTQQTRITDGTDTAQVTAAGALVVDGSASTQPVSGTVTADQGAPAVVANAWPTKITDGVDTADVTAANALKVDGSAVTQPISAATLPLPTGAATSANQTNGTQQARITDGTDVAQVTAAGALLVDASATIQPISGTVTANQGTPAATASAWPTKITDGVDTANVTAAGALQVDGSAVVQPVSGTVTALQGTTPWVENLSQVGGAAVTTQAAGEQLVAVEGRAASGAATVGNPVLSGGTDGANAQSLLTDTSGRQQVVGAAADGAAVTGNPVLMGGQDGANAQSILTDTSGRQIAVGAAADGAAVTGNPVLIAGQDGANAQSLLTDTSGRPNVVGAAAQGAAVTGNPVLVSGEDAAGNVQRLRTATAPPVGATPGQVTRVVASQTGTTSSVASSATNVTLLAANTNRLGAMIVNDSVHRLYVKCGTTASATDYTKLLGAAEDWQVPFGYTGQIDGIWTTAAGSARLTEFT